MDPSPEVLGGLLLAVALAALYFTRSRQPEDDPLETSIERLLHDLEAGICPNCEAIHPEAATHVGPHGFWTVFRCPECHYSMSAHIHHRTDDAE